MAEPRFNVERPTIEGLNDPPHFSNAVVTEGGKMVHLSGQLSPEGDLAAQFKGVYDKLKIGLAACGASPSDVIRQRVFVVDLVPEHRELVVAAMGEFYGGAKPASTLVGVPALILAGALVEIDVTAAIDG
ncbi:MAG: RidA family protein [Rhodospirillales bacterium]|jgi:enamine deaminase RidA (YjgF/YER057c/UK114 family)